MTKSQSKAPFGVQTKRFVPIGYHPKLDVNGTLQAYKSKISPCEYNPERYESPYKKYNKAGSVWKRKANSEEFAANLGFRKPAILKQRKYLVAVGGPGSYNISENVYNKKSHSILKDVNFGNEVKFFQFADSTPAPGTYTGDITCSCVVKKQLTNKPPFEWDGFIDRFQVQSKSWHQPPNLYNPIDKGSVEQIVAKLVSKKGPYNLFTGPRDYTTIKNHFAPPKKCAPDKYYTWPNGLDYLLHHPSKRRCGIFLKDNRFRKTPTVRMLMSDLTTCYRNPNDPGPATYDIKIDWYFAVEFLDIKCDHSTYTLMLTGQGVHPKLEIKPNFVVCRLNVLPGNTVANTLIEILNHCEANINVVFEKVLELEGEMRDPEVSETKIQHDKDSSGDSKASKGKKSKKKAKEKHGEKFSHNLSQKEIYSLNNHFEHKRGPSYFQILHDNVEVAASSKLNVKICFGMIHMDNVEESNPTVISSTTEKKGKKGAKAKENKKRKQKIVDPKYYIAKYNVLLGGCNFIKDMIVIGHFAGK